LLKKIDYSKCCLKLFNLQNLSKERNKNHNEIKSWKFYKNRKTLIRLGKRRPKQWNLGSKTIIKEHSSLSKTRTSELGWFVYPDSRIKNDSHYYGKSRQIKSYQIGLIWTIVFFYLCVGLHCQDSLALSTSYLKAKLLLNLHRHFSTS